MIPIGKYTRFKNINTNIDNATAYSDSTFIEIRKKTYTASLVPSPLNDMGRADKKAAIGAIEIIKTNGASIAIERDNR